MKILILSLCTRDLPEMYEISFANKSRYAARHGYDFHCYRDLIDPSRVPTWNRVPMLEKEIAEHGWDWIFWSDADSLVMNPEIKLESLVDPAFDLIVAKESDLINLGNFFVRGSPWSKYFLPFWYGQTDFINHGGKEQSALYFLMRENEEVRSHIKIAPGRLFNSYGSPRNVDNWFPFIDNDYEKGDFVIHFPGLGGELMKIRLKVMREAASRIDWG